MNQSKNDERPLVLIVDDDAQILKLLRRALSDAGFRVATAGDGLAALGVLEEASCQPALVLTDIQMPNLDGIALRARAAARWPDLPVLLMTGNAGLYADVLDVERVIRKPFTMDVVTKRLKEELSHAPARGGKNSRDRGGET